MKRVIALLLVCCTMMLALVACGGGKTDDPKGTTAPTDTEQATDAMGQPELDSKVENWADLDFGGEEIFILVRDDEKVSREWEKEDVGDDELDQAVEARNQIVESDLGVDVQIVLTASEWHADWSRDFTAAITQDVDNKLHELDIVANFGFDGLNSNLRDYYVNLLDSDTLPWLNLALPCWNQAIYENGTVNGKLYGCSGDMNLSLFNCSMIIWQNRDLYDKVKNPDDPEDLQNVAIAGNWHYAELYKWSSFYENEGSDGECEDNYGVSIQGLPYPEQPAEAIPYAWDLTFITTEANGTHKYNFVGNEKAEKALIDFRALHGGAGNAWELLDNCTCGTGGHFVSGSIVFKGDVLFWNQAANNAIREMEDVYCLLPWPKYDEGQKEYATTSQGYFTVMSILDHSESSVPTKGEAISAYLQYGTEYSYTYVRGYYFERIVKPKFFGLDDSDGHVTKSITIFVGVIDNLKFDFATIYSTMLSSVIQTVWKRTIHNGGTIQQNYEANKDTYDDALKSLEAWFGLT